MSHKYDELKKIIVQLLTGNNYIIIELCPIYFVTIILVQVIFVLLFLILIYFVKYFLSKNILSSIFCPIYCVSVYFVLLPLDAVELNFFARTSLPAG